MDYLGSQASIQSLVNLAQLSAYMPRVNQTVALTTDRTLSLADSGTHFFYNGSGTITLSFPDTLPLGFSCRVSLASAAGKVVFNKGTRLSYGNASRDSLIFQWDVCDIVLGLDNGNPIFLQSYNLALPVLFAKSTADAVRNATTMVAIPGLSLPLEANAAYDINISVPFSSVITTNTLRIGLAALPTGAAPAFEVSVWNAVTSGTAPRTNQMWTTSAMGVTGTAGTAAVVGQTMLATITGRIITSTAGNLSVTCGSIAATGNVTVASGAASMSASKVFDQGRT